MPKTRVTRLAVTALTILAAGAAGAAYAPAEAHPATHVRAANPVTHPATAVAATAGQAGQSAVGAVSKPNILLITTDDMAATDMAYMPKTAKLLGEAGLTFTHSLSPHPLCCPARAEILTGEYAQNNGVRTNGGPYGGLPALNQPGNTLPVWLQKAGYTTGFLGKYLNEYSVHDARQAGWDYWTAAANNEFGYYDYFMVNDSGHLKHYEDLNSSDLITQESTALINQWAPSTKPFFLWSSYYAPHGVCTGGDESTCANPPDVAPRHANLWSGVRAVDLDKPSFNENDISDKPALIQRRAPVTAGEAQTMFTARIRALAAVDEGVAAQVAALKAAGELDNTLILFTSDNGYLIGEHRYKGKVVPYEEALNVPLLMRGPGIPAGRNRPQTALTIDLAPTIVDAAGATAGRPIDGSSLLGIARNNTTQGDRSVLIQAGPPAWLKNPPGWMYRGVRTDRYTYVEWTEGNFVELYDRWFDEYQLANVADRPEYAAVVRQLSSRVAALRGCADKVCRTQFPAAKAPQASATKLHQLFARIGR